MSTNIISERQVIWANTTDASPIFIPLTQFVPVGPWMTALWSLEFLSPSTPNFRVKAGYQCSDDLTTFDSPRSFASANWISSGDGLGWHFADTFANVTPVGTDGIGAFIRFGAVTDLSTVGGLGYARARIAVIGRE